MKFYKISLLILVMGLFLNSSHAFAESIEGVWEGKKYSFSFWSSDIDGYWGDLRYDINFWSSDIDGILAGEQFDINFWSSDIDGFFPCGTFDINIWSSSLDGHVCDNQFSIELEDGEDGRDEAFRFAIQELLDYLPRPARKAIKRRIRKERQENDWMK